ncbi:UNVERIFIED_CONTAM: hypothetical protein FKN15_016828 [Acipenser sinensis]
MEKVCGVDQLAAVPISDSEAPLNRAQDVANPLVECTATLPGGGKPALSYAVETVSTIQYDSRCFERGCPRRKFNLLSSSEENGGGWKDSSSTDWFMWKAVITLGRKAGFVRSDTLLPSSQICTQELCTDSACNSLTRLAEVIAKRKAVFIDRYFNSMECIGSTGPL